MHHNNEDKQDDGYMFIEETIKPSSTKKSVFNYILKISVSGIAFGMFACLAFYVFSPWISDVFSEHNDIVIEKDTDVLDDDIELDNKDDTDKFIETFNDIHEVASNAASSVISIKPYSYEETNVALPVESVAGIIIAEDDREYYVLSIDSVCDDVEFWRANIRYGKECNLGLVKRDRNTGLAVFRIIKEGLPQEILDVLQVAQLGNSNLVVPGNIAMAVGDIFGKRGGTDYGIVEDVDIREMIPDRHYNMISIDMFPVASSGGFLFNIEGELIGIFSPKYNDIDKVKAVGISNIKPVIEELINGQAVPYAGIYTETISETISEEKGIPAGVYVLQVERDAPAMEAGISNGDIITEINGKSVKSAEDYEQLLISLKVGDTVDFTVKRKGVDDYVDIVFQLNLESK